MTEHVDSKSASEMLKDAFHQLIEHIPDGSAIQLRSFPLRNPLLATDDLDLLTSHDTLEHVIHRARQLAMDQRCISRVRSRTGKKATLSLYDIHAEHQIDIDLWTEFDQLVRPRRTLSLPELLLASDAEGTPDRFFPGIVVLPVEIDAALYCHHLAAKRRNTRSARVAERAKQLLDRLNTTACPPDSFRLAHQLLKEIPSHSRVTSASLGLADQILEASIPKIRRRQQLTRAKDRTLRFASWLRGDQRKSTRWVAITGNDGVGKTTLIRTLLEQSQRGRGNARALRSVVTKRLYRRTPLYRIASAVLRRVLQTTRERLDQQIAAFVSLRAIVQLRFLMLIPMPARTLLDRCLEDLLIADRKTDTPRMTSSAKAMTCLGPRVPVIQLHTPFSIAHERKPEMTAQGFDRNNDLMFELLRSRLPYDVTIFDNSRTAPESARSLQRVMQQICGPARLKPGNETTAFLCSPAHDEAVRKLPPESRAA